MREFFKGWRRKVGCVLLVVACAVASLWMRSRVMLDAVTFTVGHHDHTVLSFGAALLWATTPPRSGFLADWESIPLTESEVEERWGMLNFGRHDRADLAIVYLPYWSVAIPLTLLSAYLILWKPRKRTGPDNA